MTTYLIDASIYIFRAYFSYPNYWYSPQGYELNAVYGYARFLDKLFKTKTPGHAAAAFDESLGTCFRNELYPAYKSSRVLPDESLAFQLAACKQLGELAGVRGFAHDRYEADDLIASLATALSGEVVIVSRDKDLGQLLAIENVNWWDPVDNRFITPESFPQHYGVLPEQLVDLLALTGDKIDDVPGVPGIGVKTATALLTAYRSIEELFDRLDTVQSLKIRGAKSLAKKLAPWREQTLLAKQLVSLECNLELVKSRQELEIPDLDSKLIQEYLIELGVAEAPARLLFNF